MRFRRIRVRVFNVKDDDDLLKAASLYDEFLDIPELAQELDKLVEVHLEELKSDPGYGRQWLINLVRKCPKLVESHQYRERYPEPSKTWEEIKEKHSKKVERFHEAGKVGRPKKEWTKDGKAVETYNKIMGKLLDKVIDWSPRGWLSDYLKKREGRRKMESRGTFKGIVEEVSLEKGLSQKRVWKLYEGVDREVRTCPLFKFPGGKVFIFFQTPEGIKWVEIEGLDSMAEDKSHKPEE